MFEEQAERINVWKDKIKRLIKSIDESVAILDELLKQKW